MLSASSFNALLKTLEEPPAHVKFVFATTDVQKVPTTILSRCQRFDLKRIPTGLIARHLEGIAQNEKIVLAPEAAESIARGADGGMRDAESMLDQLVAFCGDKIDEADVLSVFGITSQQTVSTLCQHLISQEISEALAIIHEQAEAGRDLARLMSDLIAHFRNVLVAKADPNGLANEATPETLTTLSEQGEGLSMEKLLELIDQFASAEQKMRYSPNRKMHFEIAVIRAIQTLGQATLSDVLDTLSSMRDGGPAPSSGAPVSKPKASPPQRAAKPPAPRETAPAPAPIPKPVAKVEEEPAKPIAPAPTILPPPVAPPFTLKPAPEPPTLSPTSAPPPPPPAARPEPPVAVKAAPEQPSAPVDLDALWSQLNQEVREKRPLIQMWVGAGKLLSLTGRTAVVGFPSEHSLAADYCQQATHRKFLEEALGALAGRPVTLKCEVRADLIAEPPKSVEPETVRDPMESFRDDPLIRKALEIFRGEIQTAS
jgi:DNA polymerase-3 subunit gamma/tau